MPKRKISTVNPIFGRRLKQFRVICGLTQEQVASALNIERTTYTKYETGVSEPSIDLLGRIVSILGTDFNSVLGEKDMLEGSIYDTKMPMFNLTKAEQNVVIAFRSFSDVEKNLINNKVTEILEDRSRKLMSS
ncbi:MAG: helix-turn-helix domain-containing protein [Ruminococcus sp.]|nr:helix-turn-helix domain-containing protein [Ruminococcus sp.]